MIPLFMVHMSPEAHKRVREVLGSGYIGQGPRCEELERKFSQMMEQPVVLLNSCTSAIDLALHMIGVQPGDEVITTPITCTATNSPIVTRRCIPVWADVDPESGLIDPDDVANKVTKRTKAIIGVDWAGHPCDWEWLKMHGIPVIEDAAHGILTPPGGDYVCYSFQAIKHFTTGDGGMLLCKDPERAKLLRWYGLDRNSKANFRCEQDINEVGYKYQMNDIAAAIGLANIDHIHDVVERHGRNALCYNNNIRGVTKPPWSDVSSWWLYTIQVGDRPAFIQYMRENGVEVGQVHRRNDAHPAFCYPNGPLPGVDHFDSTSVSIPVGWWLSDNDVRRIVELVNHWKH